MRSGRRLLSSMTLVAVVVASGCSSSSDERTSSTSVAVETQATAAPRASTSTRQPSSTSGGRSDTPIVTEVIDGDTFRAIVDGQEERVRLIGIDAPETSECLATEATQRLGQLLAADDLRLETDTSDRDQYGRLLRIAVTADGVVNETLVRDGLAIARSYPPDTALDPILDEAQADATADAVGLWNPEACGRSADATVEVESFNANPEGDDTLVLNEEWVRIVNRGDSPVDLTGWSVRDESASNRFDFPDGFVLAESASVTIRSGCGQPTSTDLYWCSTRSAVWNNSGDTAFIIDPNGNIHSSSSY